MSPLQSHINSIKVGTICELCNFGRDNFTEIVEIFHQFVPLIVVNFNPYFNVLSVIREGQKGFRTGHKDPVDYTHGALSR